jgi:hypothetical protein
MTLPLQGVFILVFTGMTPRGINFNPFFLKMTAVYSYETLVCLIVYQVIRRPDPHQELVFITVRLRGLRYESQPGQWLSISFLTIQRSNSLAPDGVAQ